ncbi:MAG TPA: hypothetical protein VF911_07025 [Thermoanaerobaculia bacterium]|jgi:hypothetical protein
MTTRIALLLTFVLIGCASTSDEGWEDWGGFTLTDHQFAVHHRVREGAHRLELLRRTNDRTGNVRWETLDVVPIVMPENSLVCLTATRSGERADYVALAEDDPAHNHRVLRAWRIDTASRKLVTATTEGVTCAVTEEPRTR